MPVTLSFKDTNLILQQLYFNPAAGTGAGSPQANVHIGAGIAQVNGAPLMIDPGVLLTAPQNGAIETNGIHLYWTDNTATRRQLDQQATSPSVPFTLTGANAAAFAVGPNGATNPTFAVDTSESNAATGLLIEGFSAGSGVNLEVQSSGTNESLLIEAKGTGGINLNTTIGTGAVKIGTTLIVNSNNPNAVSVGPNGTTNPVFNVDASVASVATGLNVKGAAAAGGLAVSVLSSGSNENMTLDAKGSGTITIGGVSTGAVVIGKAAGGLGGLQIVSNSANALVAGANGTTNPAFNVDASTASVATGVNIKGAAAGSGAAISTLSSGANENLTMDAKGNGLITFAGVAAAATGVQIGSATSAANIVATVFSSNATAFQVGRQGATNPAFLVNANTASSVTGISITSAAAGGAVALAVISTGANESLNVNPKGTGGVIITSTGANSLAVGPNGSTNPAFNVDSSVASAATGLNIQGKAAAAGVAVSVISSGTNESLTVSPKGTGAINMTLTSGAFVVTSTSANSLAVGPNGTTNPALNIDSSAGSAATGLNIASASAGSALKLSVISSGTNETMLIDAKGSGKIQIQTNGATETGVVVGAASNAANIIFTIQSSNATAFQVGPNGSTNPAFNVDASTASSATGLNVKSAAAGAGVAVSVISSGSNENLTINAKGTGVVTVQSAVAIPAGGSAAGSILMSTTASFGIFFGSGAPTVSAAQGSIYLRSDGSSTSTRLYVNTNGATTWTNFTSAA